MLLSIAALTLPLVPGQPQVIIPAGTFDAPNGSLRGQGPWTLSDTDGTALVDLLNNGTDIVVDYEHQTIMSAQNGQPAPAAGWLLAGGFSWVPDVGVVANNIRWTTDAAEMIQEGEYRFLSPVFSYTDQGVPTLLMSVALTNTPALTTLQELAIAKTNRGFYMPDQQVTAPTVTAPEPTPPAQQVAAAPLPAAQHPMIAALTNQVTLLGAENARLREEQAALQRQLTDSAKNSLITAALSAGKLMPGMEPWANSMSIEDLSSYLSNAKPIAALTSLQTKGLPPKTGNPTESDLSEDEVAICKQLNIKPERYAQQRVAMGVNK